MRCGSLEPKMNIPAWGGKCTCSMIGRSPNSAQSAFRKLGSTRMHVQRKYATLRSASWINHTGGKTQIRCPRGVQSWVKALNPVPFGAGVAVK